MASDPSPGPAGRREILRLIALTASDDADERRLAIHVLGAVTPRRPSTRRAVTLTLLGLLADAAEDPGVRGDAAEQLAFQPGTGALRRDVIALLLAGLYDAAPEVRFWCAYALATLRVRRAIPRLRELLRDEAHIAQFWSVGEEAAWAIMTIIHGSWPAPFEPEYARPLELPPPARHELSARRGRAPGPRTSASGGAAGR